MKRSILIALCVLVFIAVPLFAFSLDYMSPGFISRAEVFDGITVDAGGWLWTWPSVVNGFGIGGIGEYGDKLVKNLAVGGGVSFDRLKWTEAGYEDDKWSNFGISAYAKYEIMRAEKMKEKVDWLPIYISILGGAKLNIWFLNIGGTKFSVGDDVDSYYDFYDDFIKFNAVALVDYPLKHVTESNFFSNVTVTGYIGMINTAFNGGLNAWYDLEDKNFSIRLGWIPLLGISADVLFHF